MRTTATMKRGLAACASTALLFSLTACGGDESDKSDKSDKATSAQTEKSGPVLPALALNFVPDFDTTGLTGKATQPGLEGEVRLPGQTVRIDSITEIESTVPVDGSQIGVEVGPAEGKTLRVVTWTSAADETFEGTAPTVSVYLMDNNSRTELFQDVSGASPFLVSVGPDAQLEFQADGHVVKVDLATGEREPDPVTDVYYRDPIRQDLGKPLVFTTARTTNDFGDDPVEVPYSAVLDSVGLTPFLPTELTDKPARWASEGTTFLLVTVTGSAASSVYVDSTRQTWTATIGGKEYDSINTVEFERGYTSAGVTKFAIFEVPADTTEVALRVAARSATHDVKDKSLAHGKVDAEATFGPLLSGGTPSSSASPSATTTPSP